VEKYCRPGWATEDNVVHALACWIPDVTNAHPEYVIHIAFPLQQWLHEHISLLRYTYIACLVNLWIDPGLRLLQYLGNLSYLFAKCDFYINIMILAQVQENMHSVLVW
jgi:hypothetical protein